MTLLNFILMVMIGFHFLTDIQKLSPRKIFFVKAACGFTVTVACLGILGHILEMPFLYYDVKSLSSGMAFHTCILFILQGLAALLILNPKHAQK